MPTAGVVVCPTNVRRRTAVLRQPDEATPRSWVLALPTPVVMLYFFFKSLPFYFFLMLSFLWEGCHFLNDAACI